jgi:flagellar biosynthesis/type III secretory pathway M-ring protein FliF/YscJ
VTLVIAAPALPLHKAGPYVAAAYIVFVVLLLVYLAIIGLRTSRTERALDELRREAEARQSLESAATEQEEPVRAGRVTRAPDVASPDGERGLA